MKQSLLKHIVALLLCVCAAFKGMAQDRTVSENLFYNSQLRFSFSPVLYDNLEFENIGAKYLKSRLSFSAEIGVSYYQHIKNGYGINIGIGLGLAPFNLNYYFKPSENSIFRTGIYKYDYEYLDLIEYEYVNSFRVFPVSVQKIFPTKDKNLLFSIDLGIKLNSLYSYPYEISGGASYYIDEVNTDVSLFEFYIKDTRRKHLISYFIKFGLVKLNSKQNTLHFSLVANYSPNKIGEGWYRFNNLTYDSYGTVKQNINYIGLELTRGLTLSKRLKQKIKK